MSQTRRPHSSSRSSYARTHRAGGAHLGLTVLTAGLWLPVWAGAALLNRRKATGGGESFAR